VSKVREQTWEKLRGKREFRIRVLYNNRKKSAQRIWAVGSEGRHRNFWEGTSREVAERRTLTVKKGGRQEEGTRGKGRYHLRLWDSLKTKEE